MNNYIRKYYFILNWAYEVLNEFSIEKKYHLRKIKLQCIRIHKDKSSQSSYGPHGRGLVLFSRAVLRELE